MWSYALPLIVSALVLLLSARVRRTKTPMDEKAVRKLHQLVMASTISEIIAINIALIYLPDVGLSVYVAPVVTVIVGIHLLPLALPIRGSVQLSYLLWPALVMISAGLACLLLTDWIATAAACAISAIIMWITAFYMVRRMAEIGRLDERQMSVDA